MSRSLWTRIVDHLCRIFRNRESTLIQRSDLLWLLAIGALVTVCSIPTAEGPSGSTAETDHAGGPGWTSVMVGPEGGVLDITEGPGRGTKLEIPPGALTQMVQISARVEESPPPSMPANVSSRGPSIDFQPDGLRFEKPVTLSLPVTRPADGVYTDVFVWTRTNLASREWLKQAKATYDPARSVIIAQIKHFSPKNSGKEGAGTSPEKPVPNDDGQQTPKGF